MASHSLLHRPRIQPTSDLIGAVVRQIVRIDAMVLGAVVIAAIMIGGLLLFAMIPARPAAAVPASRATR